MKEALIIPCRGVQGMITAMENMQIVMLNYRQAGKSDTPCRCCAHSAAPEPSQNGRRMRCELGKRHTLVGLQTTCDKAKETVLPF